MAVSRISRWLGAAMLLSPAPVLAAPAADAVAADPAPTLTGDWGGVRTGLRDAGVDVTGGYTSELATNLSGGTRHATTETSQLTLGATVDAQTLLGIRGGTFQATVTWRRGDNLVDDARLGTLLQVQEVYGRGQTWRLTEFWYRQDLGKGVSLKLGRMPVGGDFSSFSCDYMNGSFCGAPAGNVGGSFWYNWPVSQWAGRLRVEHGPWYLQVGAYAVNPDNLGNAFVLVHWHGATGVLAPAELGWNARLGDKGLPGLYKVGGWYSSADADDVLLGTDHRPAVLTGLDPLQRSSRSGWFATAQQQLTGRYATDATGPHATHGLSAFATITRLDGNVDAIVSQITAGASYVGAVPGRPQDVLTLGVARTHVNARAALADAIQTGERPDSEYAIELGYNIRAVGWLTLQPNLQYIVDPGGYSSAKGVTVLGLKTALAL